MSGGDTGPEWILSSFTSQNPSTQHEIRQLNAAAQRLWPRVRSHALKEQPQKTSDEAVATATEVWESVLQSVAKTIARSNGRGSPPRDLDAYLFGIFHHRFNRALRKERKRSAAIQHVASSNDLEVFRQAQDSETARHIEQSVQINEVIQSMDEWTRKVWAARQYGYSWNEIATFFGLTEAQAKLRFRYALAKLRDKFGF
ncbi:MAG TPA: sigma-70 family RNA polymerase sigma factor [Terriglobales bacterium]|nr:sigma-70 family RNA polymerase sigma factor [Terriglobales bacterium]